MKKDSARYDESNSCRATHQLIRNTINWAGKFNIPCNGKRPRIFEQIQKDWIVISKMIKARFPAKMCEREKDIQPIKPAPDS